MEIIPREMLVCFVNMNLINNNKITPIFLYIKKVRKYSEKYIY